MTSLKQLKVAKKVGQHHVQVIADLESLAKNIERCEILINDLKGELEDVNARFQGERTTKEDVEYLTELLNCAKKKLNWEKQMANLQKRTPAVLEQITRFVNDPVNPPDETMRASMMTSLHNVHAAMARLQHVKEPASAEASAAEPASSPATEP